jgi:hypothetical protein
MTAPIIKIKVLPKSVIKGKMDVRFPANVLTQAFLIVSRTNASYTFGVNYSILDTAPLTDAATSYLAIFDKATNSYKMNSVALLLQQAPLVEQHITLAGPVAVNNNTGIVRVDQSVGAPITLNMPLASAKSCPVLISDWKGDAGTNNITINLTGGDKFPGNLTSWKIAADTGSIFLRPIGGVGYVL